MKIIILEGIATSGKTSVKNELAKAFVKKRINFSIIGEEETLMPILDNTDCEASIKLLKDVINRTLGKKKDVVIFDRLFFTHIFRTNSSIENFRDIESMIKNQSFLAFLKIDEKKIPERITNTRKYRGKNWNEYVSKKGNDGKIYQYYKKQQRLLLNLLKITSLKNGIYDTTNMDFKNIADKIIEDF